MGLIYFWFQQCEHHSPLLLCSLLTMRTAFPCVPLRMNVAMYSAAVLCYTGLPYCTAEATCSMHPIILSPHTPTRRAQIYVYVFSQRITIVVNTLLCNTIIIVNDLYCAKQLIDSWKIWHLFHLQYRSVLTSVITVPVVLLYCSYHTHGITTEFSAFWH